MMNLSLPCPTCGHPTTPSSIGYVCVDCEKIWPRDSITTAAHPTARLATDLPLQAKTPSIPRNEDRVTSPAHAHSSYPTISPSYSIHQGLTQDAVDMQAGYEYNLKSRLKRLVIPELPSGLDETHSLGASSVVTSVANAAQHPDRAAAPASLAATRAEQYPEYSQATPYTTMPLAALETAPDPHPQPPSEAKSVSTTVPSHTPADSPEELTKHILQESLGDKATEEDAIESTESQWVLLSTIGLIIVVISIGAWLTLRNRTAPVKVRTTPQPAASQTKQSVSSEATKRDVQRKKDLHDITTALEVYKQQQGSYPAGQDIAVLYPLQYTTPPYISFVNYDPLSSESKKIKYAYTSDGVSFTIQAKLEDSSDPEAQSGYYTLKSK